MGQAAYKAAVLASSPAAYYLLDENSGLPLDSSGNALPMTASSGTPVYRQVGPMTGGAYGVKMDGSSFSRAQLTGNQDFITFEFWLKMPVLSDSNHSLVGNNNGGANGYEMITPTAGHYAFVLQGLAILGSNSSVLLADTWYYITGRRNTQWRYATNAVADGAPNTIDPNAPSGGTFNINRDTGGTFIISNLAFYLSELSIGTQLAHYNAALVPEGNYPISMPPHIGGFGAC